VLHIVKKSPYESSAFSDAINYIEQNDIMLLTEDGIYAAKKGGKFEGALKNLMQKKCRLLSYSRYKSKRNSGKRNNRKRKSNRL
jgi:Uncharacterized conserved protein involved in oxidation of intracellular sulfur